MKRKIIIALIIIVCISLIVLIGGGIYLFDFAIVRKPPLSNDITPNMSTLSSIMAQSRIDGKTWIENNNAERLIVTANGGIELIGYFIEATNPSKKLVILIHGHRSNATMMGNYGMFYQEQNYNVFMADNRGHGESDGNYVGMGWLDRLDYLQWLDLLIERLGDDVQIVFHGVSMGASTALMTLGERKLPINVVAAIADCGYSSVYEEFKYQINHFFNLPSFPILNIGSLISRIFAGYSFFEASTVKQVAKSNIPVFIIHGDVDTYNPTFMAYDIYEAINVEKKLWIVPEANHGLAYYVDPNEYMNNVFEFLNNYIYE